MAITVMVIVAGAAIPLAQSSVDRTRAAAAAHYVAGRVAMARFEAVRRSAYVAIQFVQQPDGYRLRSYVDGNRNGVLVRRYRARHRSAYQRRRTTRISLQRHRVRYSSECHGHRSRTRSTPPIRFKSAARRCSASALLESSTPGTLFLHSRRGNQFAVRVLGATAPDAHPRVQLRRRHMAVPVRHERRAAPRVCALTTQGMERARLRPGRLAHVIDLSSGWRAHRNRLAPFARDSGRDAAWRAGASVPRGRPHSAMSCRPARSRAHPVSGGLMFDEQLPLWEVATQWPRPLT